MDSLMNLLLGSGSAGGSNSTSGGGGGGDSGMANTDATPMEQLCQLKAMSISELMANVTAFNAYVKECARQNNNAYANYTGTDQAFNIDSAKEAAIIGIYCCLCIGCLLGNITVISVILANKTMRRSITNILIINLAVADFGVGAFSGVQAYMESSLQASSAAYSNSPLLCKLQQVLQVTILSGSVCILLIISIDRYMAIMHPLTQRQHRKKRWYVVVSLCCWLCALFFALPNLYFFNYSSSSRMCQVTSKLKDFFFIYYCVSVALLYVIPFAVMAFAYGRVSARLLSSINQFGVEFSGAGGGGGRGRGGAGDEPTTTIVSSEAASESGQADSDEANVAAAKKQQELQLHKEGKLPEPNETTKINPKKSAAKTSAQNPAEARKRTVQMFITIVAIFFLCKLPKTIYVMILFINPAAVALNQSMDVLVVTIYLLYLLPSATNPVIYFVFSRQYRAGLVNLLTCRFD